MIPLQHRPARSSWSLNERITTPSGITLPCQEISENDFDFGSFVTYCKRYWGIQMKDYGTTRCPEADKFIDDHKLAWKEQAERSKTLADVENTSEYEDLGGGRSSDGDEDEDIPEDTGMSREI